MDERTMLEQLCKLHLQLAADWWWFHDYRTDEIRVSPTVQRSLGYAPAELATKDAWDSIVHPSDLERSRHANDSAIRSMHPTSARIRYQTKGKAWRTMLCRMQPLIVDQVPVGLIGINREIDDILAIEAEVLQRNEDLAQVAQILSHDFRGPARHLAGITERISEQIEELRLKRDDGETIDASDLDVLDNWAQLGAKASDRLGKMIEHVLQYSRAGTKGVNPEDIDSADVVETILRDYADRIEDKNVQITVSSLPTVRYDPTMLYLILANLISNAIKFSHKNDDKPIVEIFGRDTSMEMASITVKDYGIGIAAAHQEKILNMGFRLHHDSEYPGFGYGLAIVRKILRRCGGELGVRSKEGSGSEFVVTLPAGRMVRA